MSSYTDVLLYFSRHFPFVHSFTVYYHWQISLRYCILVNCLYCFNICLLYFTIYVIILCWQLLRTQQVFSHSMIQSNLIHFHQRFLLYFILILFSWFNFSIRIKFFSIFSSLFPLFLIPLFTFFTLLHLNLGSYDH